MSAAEHFGPQLQMFIPAGAFEAARAEGALNFSFSVNEGDSFEEIKAKKLAAADISRAANTREEADPGEETFAENVRRVGVREPVALKWDPDQKVRLTEGHHRVLLQAALDPTKEIPVTHGGKVIDSQGVTRNYNAFAPADSGRWIRKKKS